MLSPHSRSEFLLFWGFEVRQHGPRAQVVPHFFVGHEKLPLAPGGKVDRQARRRSNEDLEGLSMSSLGRVDEMKLIWSWGDIPKGGRHACSSFSLCCF